MVHHGEDNLVTQQNKNGTPFMNNISAVINTYLWSLLSYLGTLIRSPSTWVGLFLVVFPIKCEMLLPQIAWALSISCTVIGESTISWLWEIHLKYLTYGYPSFSYRPFSCSEPLIFLLVKTCLFLKTVLIVISILSLGLYQWIPYSCILDSFLVFPWFSLCTTNIWSVI